MPDRIAVLGLGRTGTRIARLLRERGVRVRGSRRTPVASEEDGVEVVAADLARPETLPVLLDGARALVVAAAPGREPGAYETVYGSGLRAALGLAGERNARVVVLGSTGVYGEDAGGLVDEGTPPAPRDASGRTLLAAEQAVHAAGGLLLRLAGLYSKGRGPQTTLAAAPRDASGRPRLRGPEARLLNLVHEEDAAAAAVFALEHADASAWRGVLNVSDGAPLTRGDFYRSVARAAGLPPPVFDLPGEAPPGGHGGAPVGGEGLGKRVSNARYLELGGRLRFPSFEAALGAGEA